jgi:hypothetical protein
MKKTRCFVGLTRPILTVIVQKNWRRLKYIYRRNGVLSFLGFENEGNEGRKIEYAGWGLG